jgi:hypothetical protein
MAHDGLDPREAVGRTRTVTAPEASRVDVLALVGAATVVAGMLPILKSAGVNVDVVTTLRDGLRAFVACGGHQVLVLGPDLRPSLATQAVTQLRSVDPELLVVAYGEIGRDGADARMRRIPGFAPSSRAGAGALLKVIRARIG